MECLTPPLEDSPPGKWHCPSCTQNPSGICEEVPQPPPEEEASPVEQPREPSVASTSSSELSKLLTARAVAQLAKLPPPVVAEVLPHRCQMDSVCRMDNATCPEANLPEAGSGTPYATPLPNDPRRENEPFTEKNSQQQTRPECHAGTHASFLTNLPRPAF